MLQAVERVRRLSSHDSPDSPLADPGMPLTIKVRKDGPYAIDLTTGEINLVDHEGNPIPLPTGKTTIALCRCGASATKPFCDRSHSRIGFKGAEEARQAFDAQQEPERGT